MGRINKIENRTAVIFFDGVCNFCNSTVNFIIDRDSSGYFSFASLQSPHAADILSLHGINAADLESIVLIKENKVYRKSNAALEIARHLGGWSVISIFRILPVFFRDFLYDIIAKNRYRIFGKRDICRVPSPDLKQRFLDSNYSP